MKLFGYRLSRGKRLGGFSLVETSVGLGIVGVMFTSLFAGLSTCFRYVESSRESLRATQILAEKLDTIRLYTWDQINSPGFIPTTFEAAFYPTDKLPEGVPNREAGAIYSGRVTIANSGLTSESYKSSLRRVTVSLEWRSGGRLRRTEMTTFVAEHGLQNYIY